MKNLLLSLVLVFGLTACTPEERQDIYTDVGTHIGADAGADGVHQPVEVGGKIAVDVSQKVQNPIELILYGFGIASVALTGWFKRKFIAKKYQEVKAKVIKKPPSV